MCTDNSFMRRPVINDVSRNEDEYAQQEEKSRHGAEKEHISICTYLAGSDAVLLKTGRYMMYCHRKRRIMSSYPTKQRRDGKKDR
jgi:hypothetical protein